MKPRTLILTVLFGLSLGAGQVYGLDSRTEDFKLTASDAVPLHGFGTSVAISGDTVIVGAHRGGDGFGSAYLFDITTGQELFKLTTLDGIDWDYFGWSVAICDNMAIIGAFADDDAGWRSGSVYLFDVKTGQQLSKFTGSDTGTDDYFGASVAISGDTAIVGASGNSLAYVFDMTSGQELFQLTASEAARHFGGSVAIDRDTAIVGAENCAYLFDVTTGQKLFKLTATGTTTFGSFVAISGDLAIVGVSEKDFVGSAYLFDATTGEQLLKLTASDGKAIGNSVAISGDLAIVGEQQSGSAYVFDAMTGQELFKLTPSDSGREFLSAVAIGANTAIIGVAESAYVFKIPEPAALLLMHTGIPMLACRRFRR